MIDFEISQEYNPARIYISRIEIGKRIEIFNTTVSVSKGFRFDCTDIIENDMRINKLAIARYRLAYGFATDEQEDFLEERDILFDAVNGPVKFPKSPIFCCDADSKICTQSDVINVAFASNDAYKDYLLRIRAISQERRQGISSTLYSASDSIRNFSLNIRDITEQSDNIPVAVECLLSDPDTEEIFDRLVFWIIQGVPSAKIEYTNRYNVPEQFISFGEWEIQNESKSSLANINEIPVPYDIEQEREITITSHPLDPFEAQNLAQIGAAPERVRIKLFAGAKVISTDAAISKAKVVTAPQYKQLKQLELTLTAGRRQLEFKDRDSRFSDNFSTQFN